MMFDIPVVILAGGLGSRLSEETDKIPKPMVMVGNQPILWHLMHIYARQGFSNFIIATGYKSEIIEGWVEENNRNESWGFQCSVVSFFTGSNTQTSGRIRMCFDNFNFPRYMVTYGDGLANINLQRLMKFHASHAKLATVTSVRPPARFGHIQSSNGLVVSFGEKHQSDAGWINGGFFILEHKVREFMDDDFVPFEQFPITKLVQLEELMTYQHEGFWQPMDTLREKQVLCELAALATPPWLSLAT